MSTNLTDAEYAAFVARERERAATPARQRATLAGLIFRRRPSILKDLDGSQDVTAEAMSTLCEAFHVLEGVEGVRPWDCERLYRQHYEPATSEARRNAIRFVLSVWNKAAIEVMDEDSGSVLGPFLSIDALGGWDHGNRAAYATWVSDPWWP